MKVRIEGGELRIDVMALVESLGPKDRATVAQFLCANEYLWKAVLDCVTDERGYYFKDDEEGVWWFDRRTVLELRQKLIPLMPDVARLSVEEALRQRDEANREKERHSRWAWKMFHAWPKEEWRQRPELEPFALADVTPFCGHDRAYFHQIPGANYCCACLRRKQDAMVEALQAEERMSHGFDSPEDLRRERLKADELRRKALARAEEKP